MGNSCKIVCNYHRERRAFTASDAARVICYAREGGATWAEIKSKAESRCGALTTEKCEEESHLLETALAVLALVAIAIAAVYTRGKVLDALIKKGDGIKGRSDFEKLLDKAYKPLDKEFDRLIEVGKSSETAQSLIKQFLSSKEAQVIIKEGAK